MAKSLLKNPGNSTHSDPSNNTNGLFDFDNNFKKTQTTPLGLEISAYDHILGTDEAGRGPAAGGVFAACVCFLDDKIKDNTPELLKLNDSKKLSEKTRESLYPIICDNSIYSVKYVDTNKIEEINILNASLLAMKLAVYDVVSKIENSLSFPVSSLVLVDGNKQIKDLKLSQKTIIKGDSKSASIAAASILAKVARDNYMKQIDKEHPEYLWAKNKGYLTKEHIEAIKKFGTTKYHRMSFLKNILNP